MKVFGLTGGIASGKSTIASMLKKAGVKVIDADELAREATKPTMPAFKKIVTRFGKGIIRPDGGLDRSKLASIVFNDKNALQDLESFVHPEIEKLRLLEFDRAKKEGRDVIVYMAPLLFEKKLEHLFDKIILVTSSQELQIERAVKRDGLTVEEAKKRLASQLSSFEKKAKADEIIENNGSFKDLFFRLQVVWKRLCNVLLDE